MEVEEGVECRVTLLLLHSFAKIGDFETQYQHRENAGRNINSASKARLCKRVDKTPHSLQ